MSWIRPPNLTQYQVCGGRWLRFVWLLSIWFVTNWNQNLVYGTNTLGGLLAQKGASNLKRLRSLGEVKDLPDERKPELSVPPWIPGLRWREAGGPACLESPKGAARQGGSGLTTVTNAQVLFSLHHQAYLKLSFSSLHHISLKRYLSQGDEMRERESEMEKMVGLHSGQLTKKVTWPRENFCVENLSW